MPLTTEQKIADFKQQYLKTFIRLKETDEVLYVNAISELGHVSILHSNQKLENLEVRFEKDTEYSDFFNLQAPEPGLYEYDDEVLFLRRTAKRQWTKGLNGSNFNISTLTDQYPSHAFTFPIAEALYHPIDRSKLSLKEKLELIKENTTCVILSPQFCTLLSYDNKKWLFYYDLPVAVIREENKVDLFCEVYKQEISDLFIKGGIQTVEFNHV